MKEIVLSSRKNGMPVLLATVLLYILAVLGVIFAGSMWDRLILSFGSSVVPNLLMAVCIAWLSLGWILWLGLKVLKPQEALVLTLFGKYVGTLKEPGFYWVNPFCTAVNPAAKTKLNQSGDVDGGSRKSANNAAEAVGKKVSLKIMTLNNARQKINDCLGNPVEIGIAVMWRVTDTAKAVFNVDNYKE